MRWVPSSSASHCRLLPIGNYTLLHERDGKDNINNISRQEAYTIIVSRASFLCIIRIYLLSMATIPPDMDTWRRIAHYQVPSCLHVYLDMRPQTTGPLTAGCEAVRKQVLFVAGGTTQLSFTIPPTFFTTFCGRP